MRAGPRGGGEMDYQTFNGNFFLQFHGHSLAAAKWSVETLLNEVCKTVIDSDLSSLFCDWLSTERERTEVARGEATEAI